MAKALEKITPIEVDFAKWYVDVVRNGNLMAYGAIKGMIVFKPIAYGIWENITSALNALFRPLGIANVYLPMLIPVSQVEREKDHIAGFAPELATVTRVGKEELAEPLVIRPTSEVLFSELFKAEVNSYKDLPILYNQWANVLRWEKTTNPFLRNREFLWQEGHTVHSTAGEAKALAEKMLTLYAKFCEDYLALAPLVGEKSVNERFAGAENTYTIEVMTKDGRALQSATSHYLGTNFAKAFDIKFKNETNGYSLCEQTSWGLSTRLIGAIIMVHGDNRGIIIPPRVAVNQVDIITLPGADVTPILNKVVNALSKSVRIRTDISDKSLGFKASKSEIEGTPLRIEIGAREAEKGVVTLVPRDTLEKIEIALDALEVAVLKELDNVHARLLKGARERLAANTVNALTRAELKQGLSEGKFVRAPFAGSVEDEKAIKAELQATVRCYPQNDDVAPKGALCVWTAKKATRVAVFAKSY